MAEVVAVTPEPLEAPERFQEYGLADSPEPASVEPEAVAVTEAAFCQTLVRPEERVMVGAVGAVRSRLTVATRVLLLPTRSVAVKVTVVTPSVLMAPVVAPEPEAVVAPVIVQV
jgi:hypothetical protein